MDIQGYAGGSSTKDRLKNLKKKTVVTKDEIYNLSFEDLSSKIEKIDEELNLLKKYSLKILDKYKNLDCFRFDRDLIKANFSDYNKKIEKGLLYLFALNLNEGKMDGGFNINNSEIYGGLKSRYTNSGDIETFLQRMKNVTDGKSIFTNKQRKQLEYELAKFIKGEKSSNLTQKGTDIANIERLFLTQFREWYASNSDKVPIIFQKSFSSVFTDINSLKLKESKNDELEKILGELVKKDDETGFYSFKRKDDTEQTVTTLETLNKDIESDTETVEENKREIAEVNRYLSETSRDPELSKEKESKRKARKEAEGNNIKLTKKINEAKQKAEKIQKDANEELASIKEEYKKALAKIEEKYKDKKDEKVKDTGTKTPLNLAKKDDIDSIFGEILPEFKTELKPTVEKDLVNAVNKAVFGDKKGREDGGSQRDSMADETGEGQDERVDIKFNGKNLDGSTLFSVNDIETNIKNIRNNYLNIEGGKEGLKKLIDILNDKVDVRYVINDGLRIFVYSHFMGEFAKEIKERKEELDKYMEYAEGKFGDDELSTLRVKFGLRKRIVEAGLKELLKGILTVTYREYQEKYLLQLKQKLPGVDKLTTVKDDNIKKLLYSLENNKKLKDEIISVNKELEPKLMEFIKLLHKEDTDEKTKKEEEKKKKESDKKNKKEQAEKKKLEEKKRKSEEKKRRSEEKKRRSEEKKRRSEEKKKNKSLDKTSKSSKYNKGVSNDSQSNKNTFTENKQTSDSKGYDKQSVDKQSDDKQSVDKQSDDKQSADKQSSDKQSKDDITNKISGEKIPKSGDNLEVFKDSSVLELDPSDKAIDLTEKDYIPNSDTQSVLSLKNRDNQNLKDRLKEESRSNSIKLTKLKKQLKELMDFKDEEKETEKHKKGERFKLIQDLKNAINKNYSEKKRIEEQHRITELQLLQDKKSLQTDFELLTKENLKLKHELQVSKDKKTLESEIKDLKKQKKGRKRGKSTRKKKKKK